MWFTVSKSRQCRSSLAALGLLAAALAAIPGAGQDPVAEHQAAVSRHLQQAQVYLDQEKYSLAKEELRQAISIHANIPGAYYQLGLAHWHLRELAEAKEALQKELGFGPPDAFSLYYLGRIALSEGNTEDAIGHFERVVEIGTVLDVRRRLASSYLSVGRVDDAVALLEETVRRWPERGEIHYLLGRAYQRLGRADAARFEFELAEHWKGKLHSEIQDLVELRMLLQDKKLPEAAAKARELARSGDPEVLFSTAIALGLHGYHAEALPLLRQVVQARPHHAEAFYNIALAHVRLDRPGEAVSSLDSAVELRPEFYEARLLLGNLLAQGGDPEGAIPHLRAALRARPDNPKLAAFLGLQYMQGRYYGDAVEVLREAVEMDPGDADLRGLLVDARYRNHDFERALEEARAALAAFPDSPQSHYQVAWQLENMGRFGEARPHLENALRLDPAFGEARRMLGEIVLRLGDADGSLAHFREAIGQEPRSAHAYAGLGKALIQLKRYEDAASAMETAITIDPELASLRLSLSHAYRSLGRLDDAKHEAALFADLNRKRAEERDRDVERTYEPRQERAPR